jgi:hypothetical protein
MFPINREEALNTPNPFEKECQSIYNQAIDHAIKVVKDMREQTISPYCIDKFTDIIVEISSLKTN